MFDLSTPIENLYLVGPARSKLLKKLGIATLRDLIFYFPRAHQDLSNFSRISELKAGDFANVKAKILEVKSFRTKVRRLTLTQALLEDETASITAVWFNQPFLAKILKPNEQFIFSGKVTISKNKLQLQNPIYEQEKLEQIHTSRLVPVYPTTASLTQKQLRVIIKTYLDKIILPEHLPANIVRAEKLLDENTAVKMFHFPPSFGALKLAQKRLAFDEIFETQLRVLAYKKLRQTKTAFAIKKSSMLPQKIKDLPFSLTSGQDKALEEILGDLSKPYPANRLLQGDVGSGKTVIAALSMWLAGQNGFQAVLLAPTEVLAHQHYLSLLSLFAADNLDPAILTSSQSRINGNPSSKGTLSSYLASGRIKILIATHAVLQDKIKFKNLAMVVIDEQHRFGVAQRSKLKQISNAHLLTMSATPIPRTLALTLYGDLDISVLKELPKGRKHIQTAVVDEQNREATYEFIKKELSTGRQAFVICPLVEESENMEAKAAATEFERLSKEIFPEFKLGLLHGKMRPAEKEDVMRKFKDNEINILVSTSVVEVGVDVPNATVMLIEGAERFGLAQLHQFRGRVGRSIHKSYCFLFTNDPQGAKNPRLQAMTESGNGFELAEKDLSIRGSGDLYGTAQSGYSFRVATLSNLELVERSKQYAEALLNENFELSAYPQLRERVSNQPVVHLE